MISREGIAGVLAANANLRGIVWLMLAMPCFQTMNVMLRHVAADLPPVETMFFRNLFGFLVLVPWLLKASRGTLRTRQPFTNVFRAGCHVSGMVLWVFALTQVPLAMANALLFTSPLFVAIGAVLFMGEPSRPMRWLAVGIGFAGALLIIRPGVTDVSFGMLAVVGSALLLAISKMLTKRIARTDSTWAVVFYLNLFMALFALVPTLFVWVTPSLQHFGWFVMLALVGAAAHYTLTKALATAELTAVQPFEFSALIWASVFGFVLFAEVPSIWVFAGGAVIIVGATLIARFESAPAPARKM
jgi:drug/metabolite transporter (DMT)-like permease